MIPCAVPGDHTSFTLRPGGLAFSAGVDIAFGG